MCKVNITLSLDEQLVARARKRASALGKSLNQYVREQLQRLVGEDENDEWFDKLSHLSGTGNSRGWKFNRDELYDRS